MLTEPEKVLPKLAAQLHVDVFDAVFNSVVSALPQLFEMHSQQRTAREAAQSEFYSEFPTLKDPKYIPQVETALLLYKQMNPNATRAQAIAHTGVQVSLANQLTLPEKYLKQMGVVSAPPPVAPAAFVPASPGGARVPAPSGQPNYYEAIAQEDVVDRT